MAVSFNYIPSNMRVPLFYAEMDNSMANTATADKKSLLIGSKIDDGTAEEGKLVLISSEAQAMTKFGRGSELALMAKAYINQDPTGTLWVLPMAITDGVKAKGKINVDGEAIETGSISLYVGSTKVPVTVVAGDNAQTVAIAIATAINANKDLPITATTSSAEKGMNVDVTAKGVGVYGNEIKLSLNLKGSLGGEESVQGVALTITDPAGGVGAVKYEEAFKLIATETYYYIGVGDADSTSLDAYQEEMQDSSGRWSYARMQYGHIFTAKRGTAESLVTFGNSRNDQHVSVFGIEPAMPEPSWIVAAAVNGRAAKFYTNDPARPLQTGDLTGLMGVALEGRFNLTERNTLLHNGIATLYVNASTVKIERAITTYQKNNIGDADNSYLDSTTLFTLAEITTRLKSAITSKYPRHKLANDGTNFGPGQAIVTPAIIKSELISQYSKMERLGLVENADLFAKYLIVERNADDPNRVDVLLPPDLVNQLRVFSMLTQFRLQYSENA
ncbi:MAG: phage tail sheath subtilisin-like domain-containing protein [Succinivibrio sp.]